MSLGDIPREMWAAFDEFPLASPPPGVIANLDHPLWHGQRAVIAACVGIPVMLVTSAMRIYSKSYLPRKWTWDDSIFLVSLAAAIVLISLTIAVVCNGIFGYCAWDVKVGALTKSILQQYLVYSVSAPILIWFLKLALFSLIFNTFRPLKYVRVLIYIGLAVSGIFYIVHSIVTGVVCSPKGGTDRASYLAGTISHHCSEPFGLVQIFAILSSVMNFLVDLYLLIIPLRAISKLKLPRTKKAYVFLLFLTGGGGCIMSIIGLYCRSLEYSIASSGDDVTDKFVLYLTVSNIEASVWVIIPCMASSAKTINSFTSSLRSSFVSLRTRSNKTSLKEEGYTTYLMNTNRESNLGEENLSMGKRYSQANTTADGEPIQKPTAAVLKSE